MKIYISGGCKNGKSSYAEKLAFSMKANNPLYYIATMNPVDNEDNARIFRHQQNRKGLNFKTIEINKDICKILDICDKKGSFLIDSTTALLANEMFSDNIKLDAYKNVADDLLKLISQIENIVIVSDYIFSNSQIFDEYTKCYEKGLAYIDRQCASACDILLEIYYGNVIIHKNNGLFGELYAKII